MTSSQQRFFFRAFNSKFADFSVISRGPYDVVFVPKTADADRFLRANFSLDPDECEYADGGLVVNRSVLPGLVETARGVGLLVEEY